MIGLIVDQTNKLEKGKPRLTRTRDSLPLASSYLICPMHQDSPQTKFLDEPTLDHTDDKTVMVHLPPLTSRDNVVKTRRVVSTSAQPARPWILAVLYPPESAFVMPIFPY